MSNQDKREKVIKGLELCLTPPNSREDGVEVCHEECPYFTAYNMGDCVRSLAKDALALLKEQEPVEPQEKREGDYKNLYCGACGRGIVGYVGHLTGKRLNVSDYCNKCGKAVKWE